MTTATAPARLGLFERLSVRLLALFAATFLIAFLALWAYGISTSYLESTIAESRMGQRPQPIVIDPNLRNDLNAVMAFDATAEPIAIRDPFNDRTGIVGLNATQRAVGGTVTTRGGTGPTTAGTTSGTRTTTVTGGSGGSPSAPGTTAAQLSAVEATKQRYGAWKDRALNGEIALDPRVFSVDDLLPVGVVDGGNGTQEVLFFSEAVGRTLSFPVGTMFHDGWLTELRPDGVVFASSDERRTVRLRSWARALRSVGE